MSKVLVITTSLRAKSNSDILAARLIDGAKDAGHEVEVISLKGKTIRYCIGCLACQKTQKCIQKDDAIEISEKVKNADTLAVAADDQASTPKKAVNGLQGWIDCFEKAELTGSFFCGGLNDSGEAADRSEVLDEAYAFGKTLA